MEENPEESSEDANKEDVLQLGGNIVLSGFRIVDRSGMVIVKKVVGNYARRLSDHTGDLQQLSLHVKEVHSTETGGIFEVHGKATTHGKVFASGVSDRNLFFAVDKALSKLQAEIIR